MPTPSSITRTVTSAPTSMSTSTRDAWAWRATLVTASRTTGARCSATADGHREVERTLHLEVDRDAEPFAQLGDQRGELGLQPGGRRVQREDRVADLADGDVELVDGLVETARAVGVDDPWTERLQRHPGGEETLDHLVVEVPGDALAVLEHDELLEPAVQAGVVDRDAGDHRERDRERLVLVGELVGAPLLAEVEVPEHLAPHEDRARRGTSASADGSGGKPYESGCAERSARRSGRGSTMSRPRMPLPSGSGPIAAIVASSMPTVTKSDEPAGVVEHAERAVAGVHERWPRTRRCAAARPVGSGPMRRRSPRRASARTGTPTSRQGPARSGVWSPSGRSAS